jgi:predicted kinase
MATVHMIHGFVCVGKSTFAAELAAKVKGICISPDEWVVSVFGSNTPRRVGHGNCSTSVTGAFGIADCLQRSIVEAGVDVVLDYGFWTREDRDCTRDPAVRSSATALTYDVRCPEAVARARCAERNGIAASVIGPPTRTFLLGATAAATRFTAHDARPTLWATSNGIPTDGTCCHQRQVCFRPQKTSGDYFSRRVSPPGVSVGGRGAFLTSR